MKTSKAEEAFFRDFENVQIQEVAQEPWERFVVPLCRYVDEITFPIKEKEERT